LTILVTSIALAAWLFVSGPSARKVLLAVDRAMHPVGQLPTGSPFVLPPTQSVLDRPGLKQAVLASGRCRIAVVTVTGCGYSAALARGWVEDIGRVLDSVPFDVDTGWIVFGRSGGLNSLFSLVDGQLPAVSMIPGGWGTMRDFVGISETPLTLVIDSRSTIRLSFTGNRLPTSSELIEACR
jgi:hypothetical protein